MMFENLPSTNTPINASNLNQTINLTGFIQMYAGSTAPTGWLMCDGSAVSRSTYADLYAVIGTTYGSGDGSTTFNVPDLRGRVGVGYKSTDTEFDTLGETGGDKSTNLVYSPSPNFGLDPNSSSYSDRYVVGKGSLSQDVFDIGNLQPYIVLNYIIKT